MTNQPLPADYFTPDGVFLLKPKYRDVALGLKPYRSETSEASCLGWFIFF